MGFIAALKSLARACGYDVAPPEPRTPYVEPTYLEPWVAGGPTMFDGTSWKRISPPKTS